MVDYLLDTGFLYATFNVNDKNADMTRRFLANHDFQPVIAPISLVEVCFLIRRDIGVRHIPVFLDAIYQSEPKLLSLTLEDIKRAGEIMTLFLDSKLDFVDTALVALIERYNIPSICTYDRRDFHILQRARFFDFQILP